MEDLGKKNFEVISAKAKEILESCPELDTVTVVVNWGDNYAAEKLPICAIEVQEGPERDIRTQTRKIVDSLLRTLKSVVEQQTQLLSKIIEQYQDKSE